MPDSIVWLQNKNGVYSVRSGYHLARKVMRKDNEAESSRRAEGQLIWKTLWKMRVPSKLKVFCWRACHEILPTQVNLAKRKIIEDDLYHCCKRVAETAINAIWDCGAAQDVWAGSLSMLQKSSNIYFDFKHLFECFLEKLPTLELELFLVQAWLLWNQRNVMVHGGQMKDTRCLNKRAAQYLEDYKKAQENLAVAGTVSSRNVWQPPPQEMYKLNFDAAIFLNLKCSGFGAVIRNSTAM